MNCIVCGKELIGRQTKYCSQKCLFKYWNKKNRADGVRQCYDRAYESRIRSKVFHHYGGKYPKCVICGFDNFLALEIDHIKNNGKEHRELENIRGGRQTYNWIIKNNFPEDFQILCANCNRIKYYKDKKYKRILYKGS